DRAARGRMEVGRPRSEAVTKLRLKPPREKLPRRHGEPSLLDPRPRMRPRLRQLRKPKTCLIRTDIGFRRCLAQRDQQIDQKVAGQRQRDGGDHNGLPPPPETETEHDQSDDEEDWKGAHRGPRSYFGAVTMIEYER